MSKLVLLVKLVKKKSKVSNNWWWSKWARGAISCPAKAHVSHNRHNWWCTKYWPILAHFAILSQIYTFFSELLQVLIMRWCTKWPNMRYVPCCTFPISQNKSAEWGKQLRRAEKPRPKTAML